MSERRPFSLINKIRRADRKGTSSVIQRHEIPELRRIMEEHDDRERKAAKAKLKCAARS